MITPAMAMVIGAAVAPVLFLGAAWLTRASWRRTTAALVGSAGYGAANAVWDQIAFRFGWWSYPAFEGALRLLPLYVLSGLVAGGAFGLVGWRIVRRYGARGLWVFLGIWGAWGVIHDFGGSVLFASSNLMMFGRGAVPLVGDAVLYVTCAAISQFLIRLVGGPSKDDRLARMSR